MSGSTGRVPGPERQLGIRDSVRPAGLLEKMGLMLACLGAAATVFFLLVCLRVATIKALAPREFARVVQGRGKGAG